MKPLLNADEIIREFTIEILQLREMIEATERKIKEKEAFIKVIKSRQEVKFSELYEAIENDTNKFWKIKEITMEQRKNSFFEIKVLKKYFLSTAQVEIIEKHFMLKFTRTKFDIRITQFY